MDDLDLQRTVLLAKIELMNQLIHTQGDYAKTDVRVVSPEEATITLVWLKNCREELKTELRAINKELGILSPAEKRAKGMVA